MQKQGFYTTIRLGDSWGIGYVRDRKNAVPAALLGTFKSREAAVKICRGLNDKIK